MSDNSEKPPYEELDEIDYHGRPHLTNGWDFPRGASTQVGYGYCPPPVGPGHFVLDFLIEDMIKTIEVKYHFKTGSEAEIQADEEGAPVYKISAPGGKVIIPVGPVHKWILRLPAGTCVIAYIDKWQHDLEEMARRPKPVFTPEDIERAKKDRAEWLEWRKKGRPA